jgi:hypothetical protein
MSLKLGIRNKIRRNRAAGGFVGLLDQPFATGATAAYSLRLLREKHSGGLVRVRADDSGTDKGEADVLPRLQPDGSKIIELNSPIENLNSEAQNRLGVPQGGGDKVLADLVDAGGQNFDGLTSKWYGQTPNKNDASQSNASKQPQIVDAGSVIQENGKPALDFDGSDDILQTPFNSFNFSNISYFTVIKTGSDISVKQNIIGSKKKSGNSELDYRVNNGELEFVEFPVNGQAKSVKIPIQQSNAFILSGIYDGTFNASKQGKSLVAGDTASLIQNGVNEGIGGRNNTGGDDQFFEGTIQEILVYNEDKSSENLKIKKAQNNYYSIF